MRKVGLAITRCGEPQCSTMLRGDLSRFHCVHVVENVSPGYKAQNEVLHRCFDDGAEWAVMLDGDMEIDQTLFWIGMEKAFLSGAGAVYFKLHDPYVQRDIYSLKVVTKAWMDRGGWFRDQLAFDMLNQKLNNVVKKPVYDPKKVVATHFRDPTQFQIFKRWYARGAKDTGGFKDNTGIDYLWSLKGIALDAYKRGIKAYGHLGQDKDCHNLPEMLEEHSKCLGNRGLVCGVCVWGEFPYHFQSSFPPGDPRFIPAEQRDPRLKAMYVNRLAIGVGRLMKVPHKMFYLSPEEIPGVIPECRWFPLKSPFPVKNLNKFGMYHPDFLKEGSRFIIFDLDNIPLQNLSVMDETLRNSNGFLCRSERLTYRNIPGGDMIGFKKEAGKRIWEWVKDFLPTRPDLLEQGQERFVLREMVKDHFPEYAQYWCGNMHGKKILQWKPEVRHHACRINRPEALMVSMWGDWKAHDLKAFDQSKEGVRMASRKSQQPLIDLWENRYWEVPNFQKGLPLLDMAAPSHPSEKPFISMLVPSLSRVSICKRLYDSVMSTVSDPSRIKWRIGVVDQDPQLSKYIHTFGADKVFIAQGVCRYISQINRLGMAADKGILWVGNDDIIFRTKGWDLLVDEACKAYPDGVWMVQGEDGFRRKNPTGTLPFISKRLVDIMGHVYPFLFHHVGCDGWLWKLMVELNRFIFLPNMLNEHVHPNRVPGVGRDLSYSITQNVVQNQADKDILAKLQFAIEHVGEVLRTYMDRDGEVIQICEQSTSMEEVLERMSLLKIPFVKRGTNGQVEYLYTMKSLRKPVALIPRGTISGQPPLPSESPPQSIASSL